MNKINIPSIASLDTAGLPFGAQVFLAAVEEGLKTVDNNALYKDAVTVNVQPATIRAKSAQGQGFSISGVEVASAADYATLVSDFQALLQGYLQLRTTVEQLVKQLKGE